MRLPDRCWVPALASLALALAFVGALLIRADGDPSLLVHAGPPWTDADAAPGSLTVQDADEAFDGQFFYRLGTAPWSEATTESGVTFDLPALRNARWGYGALAWVASGGDRDLVPWALIGLNLAAAAAVGAAGGALAQRAGRPAWWGLAFALWPGFAYSLSLDTSELVASAFVLGGLVALAGRRWVVAGLALTAAALTRDTTVVVAFGAIGAGLWAMLSPAGADDEGDRSPTALAWAGVGIATTLAFGAWQLVQHERFGALPLTSSGDNNLSAPLGGLLDQLGQLLPPSGGDEWFRLASALGLIALLGVGAAMAWRSRPWRPDPVLVAWVGAVAVVVVLNAYLWSGATAFMRAATEAGLLSILLVVRRAPERLAAVVGAGLGGLWLLTTVAQVAKLG